jgi:two-component system, OmpR family, alkaline phosphatase synthesis response regulator PhoP
MDSPRSQPVRGATPPVLRVLLVEDDAGLQVALGERLARAGYAVDVESTGEPVVARATSQPFDVVLLDVMLPTLSGLDICAALREAGLEVPIIMLSAIDRVGDRVAAFKLGADDYLIKPFAMAELLARIEARTRRSARLIHRFGDVEVDVRAATIRRGGRAVELGATEFRLLCYFLERPGETLSRDELLEQVWGYKAATASRTLDVHVASLRRKLEPEPRQPRHLLTVHGLGYKLMA